MPLVTAESRRSRNRLLCAGHFERHAQVERGLRGSCLTNGLEVGGAYLPAGPFPLRSQRLVRRPLRPFRSTLLRQVAWNLDDCVFRGMAESEKNTVGEQGPLPAYKRCDAGRMKKEAQARAGAAVSCVLRFGGIGAGCNAQSRLKSGSNGSMRRQETIAAVRSTHASQRTAGPA